VVRESGASQNEAVNKVMSEVLANFSAQLQGTFGGQMLGMNDMLQQTTLAMRGTAEQFGRLTANMDAAGKGAAEAMSEREGQLFVTMERREQLLNQQMREFVLEIRSLVGESSFNALKVRAEESRRVELRLEFRELGEKQEISPEIPWDEDSDCPIDHR